MCTHTDLVPVDVGQEQDSALWGARFGRRGRLNRRFRGFGQRDVPGGVDVEFAAGGADQEGAGFGGPQEGLLQSSDEVVPEQLGYLPAHLLVGQVEADAGRAHGLRHALLVCTVLGEATEERRD